MGILRSDYMLNTGTVSGEKNDAKKQAMKGLHVDPATQNVVLKDGTDSFEPDAIDGTLPWHYAKVKKQPMVLKKPKGKGLKGGKSGH